MTAPKAPLLLVFTAVVALSLPRDAAAQGADATAVKLANPCRDVLVPDLVSENTNEREALYVLDIVTQSNWEEARRSAAASGAFKIIKVNANWDDFRKARSELFEKHGFQSNSDRSRDYVSMHISDEARRLWFECIKLTITNSTPGLYLFVNNTSVLPYDITLGFRAPPSQPAPTMAIKSSSINNGKTDTGGTNLGLDPSTRLQNGVERRYFINPIDETQPVTVNVEAETNQKLGILILPPDPKAHDPLLDVVVDDDKETYPNVAYAYYTNPTYANENVTKDCKSLEADRTFTGFICSINDQESTRVTYNLFNEPAALRAGEYVVEFEYASDEPIDGMAMRLVKEGQPVLIDELNFEATGGFGMAHRKWVKSKKKIAVSLNAYELIIDRGGKLPEIRYLIFHKQ